MFRSVCIGSRKRIYYKTPEKGPALTKNRLVRYYPGFFNINRHVNPPGRTIYRRFLPGIFTVQYYCSGSGRCSRPPPTTRTPNRDLRAPVRIGARAAAFEIPRGFRVAPYVVHTELYISLLSYFIIIVSTRPSVVFIHFDRVHSS